MTSSGGADGGRSPAAPRAVVDDLIEVRDRAAVLQTMLQGSPTLPSPAGDAGKLMEGMMTRLSSALSALGTSGGGRGSGGRRKKGAATGPHRRSSSSCRMRSKSPFLKTVIAKKTEDGKSWRKYGQKHIQDSPNPRSYFRCTHRPDQGCMATKQVQQYGSNPSEFVVSYFGEHTCRDPSRIPFFIEAAPAEDCANLISFGSAIGATASTSTNTTTHRLMRRAIDAMIPGSFVNWGSPLPQECASEEALSSSWPAGQLAAVVGSAGRTSPTVGSAPADYWPGGVAGDMAGGTGSFPSSPSSLGFMTTGSFGSFGNAGDDDLFGFDP